MIIKIRRLGGNPWRHLAVSTASKIIIVGCIAETRSAKWCTCTLYCQCSTLIFLLTCPLGNYVSSFTCRVYFFGCPKKSPARYAHCFIEFSILVPSNFMPSINPKREIIQSHCRLIIKSLHKISNLFHCNQHSHAGMMFTIDGLLLGAS